MSWEKLTQPSLLQFPFADAARVHPASHLDALSSCCSLHLFPPAALALLLPQHLPRNTEGCREASRVCGELVLFLYLYSDSRTTHLCYPLILPQR